MRQGRSFFYHRWSSARVEPYGRRYGSFESDWGIAASQVTLGVFLTSVISQVCTNFELRTHQVGDYDQCGTAQSVRFGKREAKLLTKRQTTDI